MAVSHSRVRICRSSLLTWSLQARRVPFVDDYVLALLRREMYRDTERMELASDMHIAPRNFFRIEFQNCDRPVRQPTGRQNHVQNVKFDHPAIKTFCSEQVDSHSLPVRARKWDSEYELVIQKFSKKIFGKFNK